MRVSSNSVENLGDDGMNPDDGDKLDADGKAKNRLHSLNQKDQKELRKRESSKHKLKSKDALWLDQYLNNRLKCTKKSICEGMVFAMERPVSSREISALIIDAMNELFLSTTGSNLSDLFKYKTLMYLISDILFNSVQTTEAWSYVRQR